MTIWAKTKDGLKIYYDEKGKIVCVFNKGVISNCDFTPNILRVLLTLEKNGLIEREEYKKHHSISDVEAMATTGALGKIIYA